MRDQENIAKQPSSRRRVVRSAKS